MNDDVSPSFSFSRKWSQRINVLVGVVLFLAIVVMLNAIASRHFERMHVHGEQRAKLTPLTRRLLSTLTNDVKVVCYLARDEAIFSDVRELLVEYRSASSRISVEMIDPRRDVGAAEQLKVRYGLPPMESAFVLFESQGRTKIIRQGDLFEYDIDPLVAGKTREVKRKDFKGEILFTSAIYYLNTQRGLKAYFLAGHGGPSPKDNANLRGLSKLATVLQLNGVEWSQVELLEGRPIPEDCSLLIVAGPRIQLPEAAVDSIGRYLESGGRALMLFDVFGKDRDTGLEGLMKRFGVQVGADTVKDPQSLSMAAGQDVVISEFNNHAITRAMQSSGTSRLQLMLPRSVTPVSKAGGATDLTRVEPLFATGPMGTSYETVGRGQREERMRPSQVRTNYTLAVAVERGGVTGVEASRAGTSRLVVVGDSLFLSNELIDSVSNSHFASYAINWLLDRSFLLGDIGPQPYREFRLTMTESERTVLSWIFLAAMPGGVLGLGFLVWLRRRA